MQDDNGVWECLLALAIFLCVTFIVEAVQR